MLPVGEPAIASTTHEATPEAMPEAMPEVMPEAVLEAEEAPESVHAAEEPEPVAVAVAAPAVTSANPYENIYKNNKYKFPGE